MSLKILQNVYGVVFDLDDTLYNASRAYKEALKSVGMDVDSSPYKHARRQVKVRLGATSPASHSRLLYFKEMGDVTASNGPQSLLAQMQRYEDALSDAIRAQWRALHREALISFLATAGRTQRRRRCVILTNETTRMQLIKWRAIDPDAQLFDGIITSEEIGFEKPHIKIFEALFARFDLKPHNLVMIGDHPDHDIVPASRLGMKTVLSQEFVTRPNAGCEPNYIVHDLNELRTLWV